MTAVRRAGRWIALAFALGAASVAQADDISRQAALRRLVERTEMPLAAEAVRVVMSEVRRNASNGFVEGFGRGAQLGDGWHAGVPQWDRARALVEAAIVREETTVGPVFVVGRLDVLRALDVEWSEDEIVFLESAVATPTGRALTALLDAGVASGLTQSVPEQASDEARERAEALRRRVRERYADAAVDLAALRATDATTIERVERIIGRVDRAKAGTIGVEVVKQPMKRLAAIGFDLSPQLERLAADFRATR